jgi:hypothetical protein
MGGSNVVGPLGRLLVGELSVGDMVASEDVEEFKEVSEG